MEYGLKANIDQGFSASSLYISIKAKRTPIIYEQCINNIEKTRHAAPNLTFNTLKEPASLLLKIRSGKRKKEHHRYYCTISLNASWPFPQSPTARGFQSVVNIAGE